jgi:hypothetical protein
MPDPLDEIGWLFQHLAEFVGWLFAWPIHQFTPF